MAKSSSPKPGPGREVLQAMLIVMQADFHQVMKALLNESGTSVPSLHDYLDTHQYSLLRSSVYRYFNENRESQRTPDDDFLRLFGEYIGLSKKETEALIAFMKYTNARD